MFGSLRCDVLRDSGITDPLREVIVQHFTLQPFEYDTLFPSPAVRPCFVAYWVSAISPVLTIV